MSERGWGRGWAEAEGKSKVELDWCLVSEPGTASDARSPRKMSKCERRAQAERKQEKEKEEKEKRRERKSKTDRARRRCTAADQAIRLLLLFFPFSPLGLLETESTKAHRTPYSGVHDRRGLSHNNTRITLRRKKVVPMTWTGFSLHSLPPPT